jgi:tRNA(Ile)-lysidine synthase TilS/MesJ
MGKRKKLTGGARASRREREGPARSTLPTKLAGDLRTKFGISAGARIGVAVSGGADSVALLRLLLEMREELGIVLSVVHLNHKLRGKAADSDEKLSKN